MTGVRPRPATTRRPGSTQLEQLGARVVEIDDSRGAGRHVAAVPARGGAQSSQDLPGARGRIRVHDPAEARGRTAGGCRRMSPRPTARSRPGARTSLRSISTSARAMRSSFPTRMPTSSTCRLPLSSFLRWVNLIGWAGLAIGNMQFVAPHGRGRAGGRSCLGAVGKLPARARGRTLSSWSSSLAVCWARAAGCGGKEAPKRSALAEQIAQLCEQAAQAAGTEALGPTGAEKGFEVMRPTAIRDRVADGGRGEGEEAQRHDAPTAKEQITRSPQGGVLSLLLPSSRLAGEVLRGRPVRGVRDHAQSGQAFAGQRGSTSRRGWVRPSARCALPDR